ncbi:MAG: hypothetical protein GX339_03050 [Tissierellia bacterium]|nr:hypothetical protein [Tissierellia bacterium]
MKYIVGIDSGGTKSELVAYSLDHNPILSKIGGFGNPAVSLDKTINNLISLIYECVNELGRDNCVLIAIGMAGVETGNCAELIKKYLQGAFGVNTLIMNDGEMACKAYFGSQDGILTISGTGSSCYVQKDGKGEMLGGWGHVLGDEGSGYHTVLQVFKNIIYMLDRNIPFDNLSMKILESTGGCSRSDIMNFIYNNDKNKIAGLFPLIAHSAQDGDPYSAMLIENAGRYLAELTELAYKKKNFKGSVKLGLKGGVFHNGSLRSTYIEEVQKRLNCFDLIGEDISTTRAVIYLNKSIE